MINDDYYIYVYLDPRKSGKYKYGSYEFEYEPFYIGKGKGYRLYDKSNRNEYFKNKINKIKKYGLKPLVIKLFENLNEDNYFILEYELINLIGRKDLDNGPLINFTDGGEGTSGYKHSEDTLEKLRKDFSNIKKEFEKRNYKLLTEEKEYKSNQKKLNYICPKGHQELISWNNFQKGRGCPICARTKIYFFDIKKEFEKRGYKLLTEEKNYKNNKQKLNYICPKGHNHSMSWSNFKQRVLKNNICCCTKCNKENRKGEYINV